LLIDTTGAVGRLGTAEGDRLATTTDLDSTRRHVRDLVPGIRRVAEAAGRRPSAFDAIAVNTGPGSLTGIRAGLAAAKALAYAGGCRLIGVSGFDAIASRFEDVGEPLAVLFPGQLGMLLLGLFDEVPTRSARILSLRPEELSEVLISQTWVAGPAADAARLLPGARLADPPWEASLAELATVSARRWAAGAFDDVFRLEPVYVRPSSAEEKWNERGPG